MTPDLFGFVPPRDPFVDIRNQRPSVAEEKAALCQELRIVLKTVPSSICNGDVKSTREWRQHWEKARKILAGPRSSVNDLTVALKQMKSYK